MAQQTRGSRITLAQVAEVAGVAESTASRILNGYTKQFRVRPEVKQRVLDAAERMGYRPNPIVRSIAAKRTNLVAVVGWPRDAADECTIAAAVEVLGNAGKFVGTTFLSPKLCGHELPPWRADGALVVDAKDTADLEAVEASGLPYVSINGRAGPGGDAVGIDEPACITTLLEHLASLGHRHIAVVSGPEEVPGWNGRRGGAERFERMVEAQLDRFGLTPILVEDARTDHLDELVHRFAHAGHEQGATAVICRNDIVGCYVLQAAARCRIEVPEDLSVVAVNTGLAGRLTARPLTSIAMPAEAVGTRAARLLLDRLEADQPPASREEVMPGTLLVGASCARPRMADCA